VFAALRAKLRSLRRRSEERRDEAQIEEFLLEHEQTEREGHDPRTPIPPMRNNTDWSGLPVGCTYSIFLQINQFGTRGASGFTNTNLLQIG
jgi:hypothetical protein